MKILVLSDSHGEIQKMTDAAIKEKPDIMIHLGDYISDYKVLTEKFPTTETYGVKGNCDLRSIFNGRERLVITAEGKKILIVHGHQYNVKFGLERYYFAALEAGVDIALFGHTHISYLENVKGITLMNPGSIGKGFKPSYGVIEITDGNIKADIVPAD